MSCSCSLLRSWYVFAAAVLYMGVGSVRVALAEERPAAPQPPVAEDILDEFARQNSDLYAAPLRRRDRSGCLKSNCETSRSRKAGRRKSA